MYGMNGGAQCEDLEIEIGQEMELGWRYACRKADLEVYTVVWDAGSQKRDWGGFLF